MTDAETAIAGYLEAAREGQIRLLAELVKTPSDNPPGDLAGPAGRAADLLEGLGLEVERHPVPEAIVRQVGMISATNLVVRQRFGDGPVVALNAHGDVVPPGEGWSHDPYGAGIVEGWMYGRGVAVSKSDFATYTYALLALRNAGATLGGTVELHFTYDEEVGGEIGPKWLLEQGISRPDYAISAGFSYGVVTAHNGCLHLEVEVTGRSAHAAKPFTGIDALEAASGILSALYAYRHGLGGTISEIPGIGAPQLTVGLIKGGINTNVVPDRVVFRLDRRLIPEEDAGRVETGLRELINAAAGGVSGAEVEIRRILLAGPLAPVGDATTLASTLCRRASQVLGEPVEASGVPLYTDARHYAEAGIPTVLYGAGPRSIEEANAHRANERLPLDLLPKASTVIALTVLDLLGP